jgi:hypothetical protein
MPLAGGGGVGRAAWVLKLVVRAAGAANGATGTGRDVNG